MTHKFLLVIITEMNHELDYKYFPEKSVPKLNFLRSPLATSATVAR
ncbi:hypothetical protein [Microcoleus sp. K5-D4]